MRVHELAKELGLSSKALMDLLASMKVQVKSHSSALDVGTVERVRRQVKSKAAPQPATPPGPVRIAKTPTGERILGMRKIVVPPPPAAEPVVETPAAAAPAAAPPAALPEAPGPVPEVPRPEAPRPAPAEPLAPPKPKPPIVVKPAAPRAPSAPWAQRVSPR